MIEKVEKGCYYELLDKKGYCSLAKENENILDNCFNEGVVLIDYVDEDLGDGYCKGYMVISHADEYPLFRKVDVKYTVEVTGEPRRLVGEDLIENKSALNTQVGGSHYTDQKMQPIELAYKLNATPAFCKVAKYCSRKKDNMLGQIDKAIHCVALEQELREEDSYPKKDTIFVLENIGEFTDNGNLRSALIFLYYKSYTLATGCLEQFKEEVEKEQNDQSSN